MKIPYKTKEEKLAEQAERERQTNQPTEVEKLKDEIARIWAELEVIKGGDPS